VDWSDPQVPVWDPRGKRIEDRWDSCPQDGGPERAFLCSPDHRSERYRLPYKLGERTVRACTPCVLQERSADGSLRVGPLMSHDQIRREITLKEYLNTHGPDETLNLQRLADANDPDGAPSCYTVNDAWLLAHRGHIEYDSWFSKIRMLLDTTNRADLYDSLDDLVAHLDPFFQPRLNWGCVLHVPINMTKPIEAQLERLRPYLVEARDYLYRFTRKAPPRDKSRTTFRDLYIYLLATVAGWHSSRIADEVFPTERKRERRLKVTQVIRTVARAARTAKFQPRPSLKGIDPPA